MPHGQQPGTGRQKEAQEVLGMICRDLIKASTARMETWRKEGDEVMRYFHAKDFKFDYQSIGKGLSFDSGVSKTWEAFATLAPFLNPPNPVREIEAKVQAPEEAIPRLQVVERYLNHTVQETDFYKQSRRAILDLLGYGRGVMWTGVHPRTGLVTSMWDSTLNLFEDPNALAEEDILWQARQRVIPRFEAIQQYPEAREKIRRLPKAGSRFGDHGSERLPPDASYDAVKLYEIWMITGAHQFKGGGQLLSILRDSGEAIAGTDDEGRGNDAAVDNTPLKYVVSEDGQLIDVGPWEIPWYQDNRWPAEKVVAYDRSVQEPVSPLSPALPYQRALNWIVALTMGRFRVTARLIMAVKTQKGRSVDSKALQRWVMGDDMEAIRAEFPGPEMGKLSDYLETFKWDNGWLNEAASFMELMERKFESSSGMSRFLQFGEGQTQDRSARATQLREQTVFNRIDDMKEQVTDWHSRLARKEAVALQFLKDRDHIRGLFGDQAAEQYGFLAQPEQKDPRFWMKMFVQGGLPPEQAEQEALLRAAQAFTLQDVFNEASYGIETGEGRRLDRERQIDVLRELHNQVVPTQLQSPVPQERAMGYQATAELYEKLGLDARLVKIYRDFAQQLQETPAQQPEPAPGPGAEVEAV